MRSGSSDPALPKSIAEKIGKSRLTPEGIGRSGARVFLLEGMVLKIEAENEEARREREALLWLFGRLPVPEVYAWAAEAGKSYLLLQRVEGEMACSKRNLKQENATATLKLLAEAMEMTHHVDIADCPLDSRLTKKLAAAEKRVLAGEVDAGDWDEGNPFSSPEALLYYLKENRPEEEACFTHGDFCLPNIFIREGKLSGLIDLGRAGVADRYQDIALCARSCEYNLKQREASKKLFAYIGFRPDKEKIQYYKLLDELF